MDVICAVCDEKKVKNKKNKRHNADGSRAEQRERERVNRWGILQRGGNFWPI